MDPAENPEIVPMMQTDENGDPIGVTTNSFVVQFVITDAQEVNGDVDEYVLTATGWEEGMKRREGGREGGKERKGEREREGEREGGERDLIFHFCHRYLIYVWRQPSTNQTIANYYESNLATSNFPQYASVRQKTQGSTSVSL